MNRQSLIAQLKQHQGADSKETKDLSLMIELLETRQRCFFRDSMPHHFTGSALILSPARDRVLLNHHKSLNKWLCFGGHADGEEDLLNVAIREAEEESGTYDYTMIGDRFLDIDIHPIPANPNKGESEHFHCDIRYAFALNTDQSACMSEESFELRWCDFDEAISLVQDRSPTMKRLIIKAKETAQHT